MTEETVAPVKPISDGTYTIYDPENLKDYVTIRIQEVKQPKSPLFGKRIISYLNGPDNERNFQGFAFFQNEQMFTWRRFQGQLPRQHRAVDVLLHQDEVNRLISGMQYAKISGNCCICGRKLTTPESLITRGGIGPECWGRKSFAF